LAGTPSARWSPITFERSPAMTEADRCKRREPRSPGAARRALVNASGCHR
jgi:hypothetical protein